MAESKQKQWDTSSSPNPPHAFNMFQHASRNLRTHRTPTSKTAFQPQVPLHKTTPTEITKGKQTQQTTEPVLPQIKWNRLYTAQW